MKRYDWDKVVRYDEKMRRMRAPRNRDEARIRNFMMRMAAAKDLPPLTNWTERCNVLYDGARGRRNGNNRFRMFLHLLHQGISPHQSASLCAWHIGRNGYMANDTSRDTMRHKVQMIKQSRTPEFIRKYWRHYWDPLLGMWVGE